MICDKCNVKMLVIQDEPMGRLYRCPICLEVKPAPYGHFPDEGNRRGGQCCEGETCNGST